jgi:hypothetical protein
MAERQLRFLSGVTGHDVTKIKTRCLKCGGIRTQTPQPSAAVLAGAVVPDPPDFMAALRAARKAPSEPQRLSILAQPALPTESEITALSEGDTVPSPAFETMRDSLIAFRDSVTKKWRK